MNFNSEHPSILRNTRRDAAAFWTAISSVAACVAALFAGWAAIETRNSAIEANKATRASVWLQVLSEYASPEILASMKELRGWQQKRPKDFAEGFKDLLNNPTPTKEQERLAKSLDLDRRRVSQFFRKLEVLCEGGILDESFVGKQWSFTTYTFIADVIVPMERAKADALAETKSITLEERAAGEKGLNEELDFYHRVCERTLFGGVTSPPDGEGNESFGFPSP